MFGANKDPETAAAPDVSAPRRTIQITETFAMFLGVLGIAILISGLGFWTVKPPGEDDLCQVKVLGQENKTKAEQDAAVGACHTLYTAVFNMLHTISVPFILCGILCWLSTHQVASGAMSRTKDKFKDHVKRTICFHVGGVVAVSLPALMFPVAAASVAAFMAPVHAYFISIMVGHFAISLTGAASNTSNQDPGVRQAAQAYETFYLGYCAASRVELCLWIGSTAMVVLFWFYLIDIGRNFWLLWSPPEVELLEGTGCQLCALRDCGRSSADAQE